MSDKTRRSTTSGIEYWEGSTNTHYFDASVENRWDAGKDYWGPFGLTKVFRSGARVNAEYGWSGQEVLVRYIDYPSDLYWWEGFSESHLGINVPSIELLTSALFSAANPSKPAFSVAQFAGEMKDIPNLLRVKGHSLLKRAANGYINYRFAWQTLIKDFSNMWDLQSSFERRLRTLKNLRDNGSSVEKASLYHGVGTARWENQTLSQRPYLQGPIMGVGYTKIWGAVKYELDSDYYDISSASDEQLTKLVERSLYGLYEPLKGEFLPNFVSLSDIWELLPWSWLADYFTNIGDLAAMTDNRLGLTPSKACIMHSFSSTLSHQGNKIQDPWGWRGSVSPGYIQRLEKSRYVVGNRVMPLANKPLLSDRQLNIIAALLVSSRTK